MDLYEALKNGTDAEELVKLFQTELANAKTRLAEEEAAAAAQKAKKEKQEAMLQLYREDLADCIVAYFNALQENFYEEEEENSNEYNEVQEEEDAALFKKIYTMLESMEKTFKNLNSLAVDIESTIGKNPVLSKRFNFSAEDDDIIRAFLDTFN